MFYSDEKNALRAFAAAYYGEGQGRGNHLTFSPSSFLLPQLSASKLALSSGRRKRKPCRTFLGRVWPAESDAASVQATDCDAANGTNPGGGEGGAILFLNVSVAAPTSFHYGRKKKRAEQIVLEECALFPAGYKATVQNPIAGRNNGER